MKKRIVAVFCLAAVLLMSGCKIQNMVNVDNKTLQQTAAAIKTAGNYTFYGLTDMVLTSNEGESASTVETLVNVDLGEEAKYNVLMVSTNKASGDSSAAEMYVHAKETESFRTYVRVSEDQWTYQDMKSSEYGAVVGAYDMNYVISNYLQFASWEEAGEERVTLLNGEETVDCIKFNGVIKGANVSTVVGVDGAIKYMGLNGLKEKHYDERISVPVTLWVEGESLMPVKAVVEYTEAFRKVLENVNKDYKGDDENVKSRGLEKYTYELCFLGFGTTEAGLPEGAEDAMEYSEYQASLAE